MTYMSAGYWVAGFVVLVRAGGVAFSVGTRRIAIYNEACGVPRYRA